MAAPLSRRMHSGRMVSIGIYRKYEAGPLRSRVAQMPLGRRAVQGLTARKLLPRHQAAPTDSEESVEDLWQYDDRKSWYEAKFAADDQPDWQPATFVSSVEIGPSIKLVTFDIESSRELVPLRNAYKHIGQYANIRVNGGEEIQVPPSSPPLSPEAIRTSLLRVRNDLPAGDQKLQTDPISERQRITLLVTLEGAPELYKSTISDLFEVGPFQGTGLDLLKIQAIFRYPTIVVFVDNAGIATARSLITSKTSGLHTHMRSNVHVYYRAPNKASTCFADEFDSWAEEYGVSVMVSTRDTFQEMFDDDDTLVYDPEGTAAIILTGNDANEMEEEALEACKAAEIETVVRQTVPREATTYLSSISLM
ncbi:hypothetical protein M9434_001708 [Picochlorum sp. BPE23]|nr:hypothetical protein M9434_001708 [Picochlorum sp. BPE23]